jgi:hypothetical protein
MDRRTVLGLAAAAGTGLVTGTQGVAAQPAREQRRPREYVEAGDGTRLFVRDWGSGSPVLFLAGWTLASDFWFYQMAALQAQGLRCLAYDGAAMAARPIPAAATTSTLSPTTSLRSSMDSI